MSGKDGKDSEFSILDIPGIQYEVVREEEEEDEEMAAVASTSRNVSAVPSGSGLTFLLESSDADSDHPMRVIDAAAAAGDSPRGERSKRGGDGEIVIQEGDAEPAEDDDEEEHARRRMQKELTDKYMAGQLSFRDFVRQINVRDSDDEDEDDDVDYEAGGREDGDEAGGTGCESQGGGTTTDEEWRPGGRSKARKSSTKQAATSNRTLDKRAAEEFEAELDETQRQNLSHRSARSAAAGGGQQRGARRRRLDPALQGLMGEANLRFARGDADTAARMCMEVIRQDPSAPEPFQTLSTLYEDGGEQEKSLQFAVLAAHLVQPQDPEEWARLADLSLEMEDAQQAADCYKKAIDADPSNMRNHLARCSLLERMGEVRAALRGYKRLLSVLKPEEGSEYLYASKEIARILHERDDMEGAKNTLRDAINKHPDKVDPEDVNLLLELLLALGQNDEALEVLCRHCGVKFASEKVDRDEAEGMEADRQLEAFSQVVLPTEEEKATPIEIRTKLAVVLVNLGAAHLARDLAHEALAQDPEEYGDLMLEAGEAFMAAGIHDEALPFLEKLVSSDSYAQAEVWLKYGECLLACGRAEESERAYQNVVSLAPNHLDARRTLSSILHKLGRPEEALHTLTQDEEAELLDPTLLYERCQLLLSEGREDEFVNKAKLLFSRHFVKIRNREELHAIASAKKLSSKNKALLEVRQYKREPVKDKQGANFEQQASEIPVSDEFVLFRRLCDVLHSRGHFAELQRATFSALGSPHFNKRPEVVKELEFLCLLASFLNGDSYHAYNLVRELVFKHMKNSRVWNLLNLVIMRADDVRHNRFLMRLMSRHPDNQALGILNGHNCLVAGTYKYSLGEYMSAFRQDPSNPMVALMLGLTFTHMACQKFSAKKHSLVVQACAFLNQYLQLRGRCQESYYNLGRAMHQLGLLPAAVHYYKKALALDAAVEDAEGGGRFDLKREAAFNLSLIYQSSGSPALARMYIQKHIVV